MAKKPVKRRKTYDLKTKVKAVNDVLVSGASVDAVAKQLGCRPSTISRWVGQAQDALDPKRTRLRTKQSYELNDPPVREDFGIVPEFQWFPAGQPKDALAAAVAYLATLAHEHDLGVREWERPLKPVVNSLLKHRDDRIEHSRKAILVRLIPVVQTFLSSWATGRRGEARPALAKADADEQAATRDLEKLFARHDLVIREHLSLRMLRSAQIQRHVAKEPNDAIGRVWVEAQLAKLAGQGLRSLQNAMQADQPEVRSARGALKNKEDVDRAANDGPAPGAILTYIYSCFALEPPG